MTLSLIGAGFGRTGTVSVKLALERLGKGPCYHMLEVLEHPDHIPLWEDAEDGKPDWDRIFDGYPSAVDWPVAAFVDPLRTKYPDAKVLLTVREPNSWYKSVRDTIHHFSFAPLPPEAPPFLPKQRAMARRIVWDRVFGGKFEDKEHALGVFHAHIEKVKTDVPANQLLVFDVKEGWEPLCRFLDCPVPDEPFPRANTTEEFKARFA